MPRLAKRGSVALCSDREGSIKGEMEEKRKKQKGKLRDKDDLIESNTFSAK